MFSFCLHQDREQIRCMECLGHVLAVQPVTDIMSSLERIVTPHIMLLAELTAMQVQQTNGFKRSPCQAWLQQTAYFIYPIIINLIFALIFFLHKFQASTSIKQKVYVQIQLFAILFKCLDPEDVENKQHPVSVTNLPVLLYENGFFIVVRSCIQIQYVGFISILWKLQVYLVLEKIFSSITDLGRKWIDDVEIIQVDIRSSRNTRFK